MSNYQDHLEPYRHLVRQMKSVPPACQQTTGDREDLQPYRHMAHEIQLGKGAAAAQPPAWPDSALTSSPLAAFAAARILDREREENAHKLRVLGQKLEVSQQPTANLGASLVTSRVEKVQQIEQELSRLRGQLVQRVQENRERAERLTQLQRELDQAQQREIAAQAQQQEEASVKRQAQLASESMEVSEILQPSTQAQKRQVDRQPRESLADITAQGSFPMIVMFMALVVVAFSLIKLASFIWPGLRTLFSAVVTRVQAANLPRSLWAPRAALDKRAVF